MTNVLIPTDFTPSSLKLAEKFLKNENLNKCNFILFHAFGLPASPIDLLTSVEKDPTIELMNEPFRQACKQLKDDYPSRIGKITVRCMHGDTRAVFRNFIEANDIDVIYCPEDYVFIPAHKRSINPCYLFKRSTVPVMKTTERKAERIYQSPAYNVKLSTS